MTVPTVPEPEPGLGSGPMNTTKPIPGWIAPVLIIGGLILASYGIQLKQEHERSADSAAAICGLSGPRCASNPDLQVPVALIIIGVAAFIIGIAVAKKRSKTQSAPAS